MQARYDDSMASKRLCMVAAAGSSTRGTADSAGAENSGSPSAAASATSSAALAGTRVPRPFGEDICRSPGDDVLEVPSMTEEAAARVTRGFMAVGCVRNVVKAVEKALFAMGAQVCVHV